MGYIAYLHKRHQWGPVELRQPVLRLSTVDMTRASRLNARSKKARVPYERTFFLTARHVKQQNQVVNVFNQ